MPKILASTWHQRPLGHSSARRVEVCNICRQRWVGQNLDYDWILDPGKIRAFANCFKANKYVEMNQERQLKNLVLVVMPPFLIFQFVRTISTMASNYFLTGDEEDREEALGWCQVGQLHNLCPLIDQFPALLRLDKDVLTASRSVGERNTMTEILNQKGRKANNPG